MSFVIPPALLSVLILVVGALVILCLITRLTSNAALLATIGVVTLLVAAVPAISAEPLTMVAVLAIVLASVVAMLLVPGTELHETTQRPEVAALVLLGASGAIVLATAGDLLSAVVGLETLSLAAAVLVGLSRGVRPVEAAFKYFVLAAISFAVLVYGMGLIFLSTGSFAWPAPAGVESPYGWIWILGVTLAAIGISYKLAVVPLHWGPLDAYTAAAPGLAGYVMAASKLGAVFALGRLVAGATVPLWPLFVGIGLVSIVWGTFGALAQREVRRMLAYSTVANAGFVILALGCGADGRAAAVFYTVVYSFTALLIFAALAGRGTGGLAFADVASERFSPLRALALTLGLLSLSGIPPTPGFWVKLAVLDASWSTAGFWPTLIAALGGVAGVLYYLRPVPDLLSAARSAGAARLPGSPSPAVILAGVAVIVLGLAPGLAYALARLASGA